MLHRIEPGFRAFALDMHRQATEHGEGLWARDPSACVAFARVLLSLERSATSTRGSPGVCRAQSPTRVTSAKLSWDEPHGRSYCSSTWFPRVSSARTLSTPPCSCGPRRSAPGGGQHRLCSCRTILSAGSPAYASAATFGQSPSRGVSDPPRRSARRPWTDADVELGCPGCARRVDRPSARSGHLFHGTPGGAARPAPWRNSSDRSRARAAMNHAGECHVRNLEAEPSHAMREIAADFKRPVLPDLGRERLDRPAPTGAEDLSARSVPIPAHAGRYRLQLPEAIESCDRVHRMMRSAPILAVARSTPQRAATI